MGLPIANVTEAVLLKKVDQSSNKIKDNKIFKCIRIVTYIVLNSSYEFTLVLTTPLTLETMAGPPFIILQERINVNY